MGILKSSKNKIEKGDFHEEGAKIKSQEKTKKPFLTTRNLSIFGFFLIVLVVVGAVHLRPDNCNGLFCGLTGNAILSDNSLIVAEFDGGKITSDELDKNYDLFFFLNGIPKSYSSMLPKDSFLNQTISEEILYLKAVDNGYKLSDKEIETQLENSLLNAGTSLNDFKEKLIGESLEYGSVLSFYKKQIIISKFLNATLIKDLTVSDKDLKDYYDKNKGMFETPDQVRASHILVNSSEEANKIIKELDSGKDFAELAKKYSMGPSASKGGDLGFFGKGQMVPEFERAVFSLANIGDYTKTPVKTQFGYHVIKLTGKQEAKMSSFDESKQMIKEQLLKKEESEMIQDYLKGLLKKSNIKIYEENIKL